MRVSKTNDGTVSVALQRQDVDLRAELIGAKKSRITSLDKIFDFSIAKEVNRELAASGWKPTE